jgi:TonB-linked SusC/RagA family outer membrane protein
MSLVSRCLAVLVTLGLGLAPGAHGQSSLAQGASRGPDGLLDRPALLDVRGVSLTEALTALSENSGVVVAFSPTLLSSDGRQVDCRCHEGSVAQALDQLLSGTSFRYAVRDGQVILTPGSKVTPKRAGLAPRGSVVFALANAPLPTLRQTEAAESRLLEEEQEGSISGTVVDQTTKQPLLGARVSVVGTNRAAQTDTRGAWQIGGLTGQEVTIEVVRVGYRKLGQTVRVGATNVVLELAPQVIKLDELVVTGTAGAQEVRSLGNAITRVNATALEEIAPSASIQNMLATQVPGLAIQSSGGNVGSGGTFRLRGASSVALASNPLVYVDGVRVDNNPAAGTPRALFDGKIGNDVRFAQSRINDLNPDEIESIQVIKGPSAATLYGTEASNGVIQIVTKRGKTGRPEIQLTAKQGANWLANPEHIFQSKYYRAADGTVKEFNVLANDRTVGFPVSQYGYCPDPYEADGDRCKGSPFSTGLTSSLGATISGGTESIKYFFSGDFERDEGTVSYNWQNKLSTRGNITWAPNEKFGADIGIGYTRSKLRSQSPMNQPIIVALDFACPSPGCEPGRNLPNGADGPFRGYQFVLPERLANETEGFDNLDRVILNGTFRHRPVSWLNHRLTVGGDFGTQRLTGLARRAEGAFRTGYFLPNGARALYNRDVTYASADYGATGSFKLGKNLSSETSAGMQYYVKRTQIAYSTAENLAVSTLETLGAGSIRNTDEEFIENKTFGAYAQQQIGWKNRFFLTGALRGDDNSAFGTEFDFVLYPKLSASWVVSEEPFFKGLGGLFSTLKLRGAWGEAGQQPDAFVALQTFRPYVGDGGTVGLTTDNFGNPDLKPEVAREVELGFDAGLFDERIGLEFTYYNKTTNDAIIPVQLPPSTGFSGNRLLNLGQIRNKGAEVAANATVYRSRGLTIDVRSAVSFNSNEVISIGAGRSALVASQFNQYHVPGFPVASFFARRVVSADLNNAVASNVMCEGGDKITGTNLSAGGGAPVPCAQAPEVFMGGVLPKWQGASSVTIAIGPSLQLFGQVDYMGGHYQRQAEVGAGNISFRNGQRAVEGTDPILEGIRSITFDSRLQGALMRMGFAKVRDLSATYTFASSFAKKFGTERLSITASARNLWTVWQSQKDLFGVRMKDPEVRINGLFFANDPGGLVGNQQDAWPTARRFLVTLRMTL